MKLLWNCHEVARRATAGEFETASWPIRLAVRMHMAMCRHCQRFGRQMALIARAVRERAEAALASVDLEAFKKRTVSRLAR